jgi:hypothetical protein
MTTCQIINLKEFSDRGMFLVEEKTKQTTTSIPPASAGLFGPWAPKRRRSCDYTALEPGMPHSPWNVHVLFVGYLPSVGHKETFVWRQSVRVECMRWQQECLPVPCPSACSLCCLGDSHLLLLRRTFGSHKLNAYRLLERVHHVQQTALRAERLANV